MKNHNFYICILVFFVIAFHSCSSDDDMAAQQPTDGMPPVDNQPPSDPNPTGLTLIKEQNFGGTAGDFAGGAVATSNGGYIFSGIQADENAFLIAADSELNTLWEKEVGISGTGSIENIVASADGNYLAAGFTQTDATGVDFDLYVIKIDVMGNTIWEKTYGVRSTLDTPIDLIETSEGNILVVGSIQPILGDIGAGINDISATLINADGTLLWNNTYGGSNTEVAASVIEESDGNFLILGTTVSEDGDVSGAKGDGDVWIVRIDGTGQLLEQAVFGSSGRNGGTSITALQNGNYIVTASNNNIVDGDITSNNGAEDLWVFTIDSSLHLLDEVSFGGSGHEGFRSSLAEAPNGDLFLATGSNSTNADVLENKGGDDYWVLKLSPSMEILDQVSIGGSDSEFVSEILFLGSNQFLVLGSSASSDGDVGSNMGDFDIWAAIIEDFPKN